MILTNFDFNIHPTNHLSYSCPYSIHFAYRQQGTVASPVDQVLPEQIQKALAATKARKRVWEKNPPSAETSNGCGSKIG